MTKVLREPLRFGKGTVVGLAVCAWPFLCLAADVSQSPPNRPAEALYLQLGHVGLDPARVYRVREASLERSAIHLTLEDGTIAFTQDVMGRTTGAFFEGEGEILLTPPNQVERKSLSRFTGMAILEERFATAYFRFNDDVFAELRPGLRVPEDAQEFVSRWNETARNLAALDAVRLFVDFSRLLPVGDPRPEGAGSVDFGNRMLHVQLQGMKLGIFDVIFDSTAGEPIEAGQLKKAANGDTYYDVWTSFSTGTSGSQANQAPASQPESKPARADWIAVRSYAITTDVRPPTSLHAEARLQADIKQTGQRTLLFELSRFLQVESVEVDGHAVEFIHNPAVEGTQLARKGNDLVAVVLPEPTRAGQRIDLRFVYGGDVLAEAAKGLLYVGARGTWYPNRGMAIADFDLVFHYPPGWTLVATGKPTPSSDEASRSGGEQSGRWASERPIPFAGFNLGKYKVATAQAGKVAVDAYATAIVERDFPSGPPQVVVPPSSEPGLHPKGIEVIPPPNPSPARHASSVAEAAARAIEYYAARFGPYPYSRLALTQLPGRESQGWPGLVFLSSYAFLTDEERAQLHYDPSQRLLEEQTAAHETAHQWWGDLVMWNSYRDQWISEGLANYSALMMLQEKNPAGFRQIMDRYREELVDKNKDGESPMDAGPVTLGARLFSSLSPEGYEAISYGRGTWLFHMLRSMLLDGASPRVSHKGGGVAGPDDPFVRSLRKLRQRYEGKFVSTREMLDVFAEDLPPALRYEGKNSLDWFLDGWVNGTAMPKLGLRGVKFTTKEGATVVSGIILQKQAPEDLVTSVPVYAMVSGKPPLFVARVFADGEETPFRLTAPAGTHKILLDPNETVLTNPK